MVRQTPGLMPKAVSFPRNRRRMHTITATTIQSGSRSPISNQKTRLKRTGQHNETKLEIKAPITTCFLRWNYLQDSQWPIENQTLIVHFVRQIQLTQTFVLPLPTFLPFSNAQVLAGKPAWLRLASSSLVAWVQVPFLPLEMGW